VKVAVVEEAGTVTEAGTDTAEGRLLVNETTFPPAGAALDRVTVQDIVAETPIEPLGHCTDVRVAAGATARTAVWFAPFSVAVIVEFWAELTAAAVAMKLAVVEEAGIVTVDGTVTADVLLLDNEIAVADVALRDKVTVHVVVADGSRDVAVHCREDTVAAATRDSDALLLAPLSVAVTMADWSALKEPAVALKVAVEALAATLTLEGTVSAPVEARLTEVSAVTAPLNDSVHTATPCGPKVEGEQLRPPSEDDEAGELLVAVPPLAVTEYGVLSNATA
jgi:hypothetical protein